MKSFYISLLAFALITQGSCKKFLETEPSDFLAPETYYNTEKELMYALTGVYDVLGSPDLYGDNVFYHFDITDEGYTVMPVLLRAYRCIIFPAQTRS